MTRVPSILMTLSVTLALTGCDTKKNNTPTNTPDAGSTTQDKTAEQAATPRAALEPLGEDLSKSFPIKLPANTVMLSSMDLSRLNPAVERMREMLPEEFAKQAREQCPSSPAVCLIFEVYVTGVSREERAAFIELIDPKGRIHIATSKGSSGEVLEALRLGAPISTKEFTHHTALFRVLLPATDPAALKTKLEALPESYGVTRVEITGSNVQLDMVSMPAKAAYAENNMTPIPWPDAPGEDTQLLAKPGPALSTFLQSDDAFKFYASATHSTEISALNAMRITNMALRYSSPENWQQLITKQSLRASDLFVYDDPARHEVGGTAIMMNFDKTGPLTMSTVRSLTPLGRTLTEKLATHPKQPITDQPDAILSATMNQDFAAIKGDVELGREAVLYDTPPNMDTTFGASYLPSLLLHSPMMARHITLKHASDDLSAVAFAHGIHVNTAAKLEEKTGPNPAVVIDMLMPTPAPPHLDRLEQDWKSIVGSNAKSSATIEGNYVKLTAGEPVGETKLESLPDYTFVQGFLDFNAIASRLKTLPPELFGEMPPALLAELEQLARLNFSATSYPTYTLWNGYTGKDEHTPKVVAVTPAIAQPEGYPDCLYPIIKRSRDTWRTVVDKDEQENNSKEAEGAIGDFIDAMPELRKSCSEAGAQIDIMHARWLLMRSERLAAGDLVKEAKAEREAACKLGLQAACEPVK